MSVDATIQLDTFDLARLLLGKSLEITIRLHVGSPDDGLSEKIIREVVDDPDKFLRAIAHLEEDDD